MSASGTSGLGRPPDGLSRKRLFVVVHKGASEEGLARLFRSFPGMEYCDLKRDRLTGLAANTQHCPRCIYKTSTMPTPQHHFKDLLAP